MNHITRGNVLLDLGFTPEEAAEIEMLCLRCVQMQKFINPQVIDSSRQKGSHFPIIQKWNIPQYSLYTQYVRKNYVGR